MVITIKQSFVNYLCKEKYKLRREEKIVKESIGNLSAELEAQELEEVVGAAGSPVASAVSAIVSAISAVSSLSYNVNRDITAARNCGVFVTVSYECTLGAFRC